VRAFNAFARPVIVGKHGDGACGCDLLETELSCALTRLGVAVAPGCALSVDERPFLCEPTYMQRAEQEIRARVESFASELAVLVRRAAFEAVQASLQGEIAPTPAAPRGRPKAAPTARAARPAGPPPKAAAPAKKPAAATRAPGQKRDPKELAKLVERLADHIKANPGQRIEQINKALGVPTKDLNLPIRKLLSAKRITTKGQKRATTYFPK